jgi:hypothetical protein
VGEPPGPGATAKEKVDWILAKLGKASPRRKAELMESLITVGGDAATYLAGLLETVDDGLLDYAGTAVARMKDRNVLPIAEKLLESKKPGVRSHAVGIVASFGDPGLASLVTPLLEDPEPRVRVSVISALRELKIRDSFDRILERCGDPDRSVRTCALAALFSIAESHGLKAELAAGLSDKLRWANGEARIELAEAVGQSGQPARGRRSARPGGRRDRSGQARGPRGRGRPRGPPAGRVGPVGKDPAGDRRPEAPVAEGDRAAHRMVQRRERRHQDRGGPCAPGNHRSEPRHRLRGLETMVGLGAPSLRVDQSLGSASRTLDGKSWMDMISIFR